MVDMTRDEFEKRLEVESEKWIGVSYVHNGRSKTQGVDCLGLIVLLLRATGLEIIDGDGKVYEPDWYLHTPEERYMEGIYRQGVQVERDTLLPGDVVFFKPGILVGGPDMITHGGIYLGKDHFIHCITGRSVERALITHRAWVKSYAGAVRSKALIALIGES